MTTVWLEMCESQKTKTTQFLPTVSSKDLPYCRSISAPVHSPAGCLFFHSPVGVPSGQQGDRLVHLANLHSLGRGLRCRASFLPEPGGSSRRGAQTGWSVSPRNEKRSGRAEPLLLDAGGSAEPDGFSLVLSCLLKFWRWLCHCFVLFSSTPESAPSQVEMSGSLDFFPEILLFIHVRMKDEAVLCLIIILKNQ